MTLLGNFVRTREQGEKSMDWRSMNGIRSSSRALSFLRRTLIIASHASFAPFVPYERLIFFLSGHAIKISQQSHLSRPTGEGPCSHVSPRPDAINRVPTPPLFMSGTCSSACLPTTSCGNMHAAFLNSAWAQKCKMQPSESSTV